MSLEILEQLEKLLDRANARRRTRCINMNDLEDTIKEAIDDGYGYVTGGTVANAYKYPATAAACAAVRLGETVLVRVGSVNASKTHSPVTWFGPASARDKVVREWIEKQTVEGLVKQGWEAFTVDQVSSHNVGV
jgi:hypothetical protein